MPVCPILKDKSNTRHLCKCLSQEAIKETTIGRLNYVHRTEILFFEAQNKKISGNLKNDSINKK